MRGIEIGLVIATGLALAAGGFLLLKDQEQTERVRSLERELAGLRTAGLPEKHGDGGPSPAATKSSLEPVPVGALPQSDLADQVAELAAAVNKLEQTAEALDTRITRSRLAVPDEKERAEQIKRGQARLAELRKSADEAREKARQIAVSLNVPFDEKRLLEPGATPALEEKPEFVAARDAAAAEARVVALFEKKLADLHFATVIEALPSKDER